MCSEGASDEELEIRRYAIPLLHEFFRDRGRELKVTDYRRMLKSIFRHLHQQIARQWPGRDRGLDLAVVIASASTAYAARCGKGGVFLFHEGRARSFFKGEGDEAGLLGAGPQEKVEVEEAPLQPGDIAVLCNPAVAEVMGVRDVTLILRRASDPPKASLFLSAIAERKGAEGPLTALIWEVPNFQGAAMLTDENPTAAPPEAGEAGGGEEVQEEGHAEQVKRQWLSKWRRRKD